MDVLKTISKNIKKRRLELGLNQEQLGKKAKLSSQYISNLETRPKNLTIDTLVRLSKSLNCNFYDLICDDRYTSKAKKNAIHLAMEILEKHLRTLD